MMKNIYELFGGNPVSNDELIDRKEAIVQQEEMIQSTMEKFQTYVDNYIKRDSTSVIDAIVDFCEEHGFEIESIKDFMTPKISSMLEEEAERKNLIKSTGKRLPGF